MNTPRTALEELERIADEIGGPKLLFDSDRKRIASAVRTHGKAMSEALGAEQVIALLVAGGFLTQDKLGAARRIIASANWPEAEGG